MPLISVGNITTGGTGKTPFVISLTKILISSNYKVGIITRGYRREGKGQILVCTGNGPLVQSHLAGDEPYIIAKKVPEAVIIADEDRLAAARAAIKNFNCNILVSDDGFQHRQLGRDIDIVLWDAYHDPNKEHLIPLGRMRESWSGLKRASLIVFTRTNTIPGSIRQFFAKKFAEIPLFASTVSVDYLKNAIDSNILDKSKMSGREVLAFCGIGNPSQFFLTVKNLKPSRLTTKKFGDHHKYTYEELHSIKQKAECEGCSFIITTEKDAANFPEKIPPFDNLLLLNISLVINEKLKAAILDMLSPSIKT